MHHTHHHHQQIFANESVTILCSKRESQKGLPKGEEIGPQNELSAQEYDSALALGKKPLEVQIEPKACCKGAADALY